MRSDLVKAFLVVVFVPCSVSLKAAKDGLLGYDLDPLRLRGSTCHRPRWTRHRCVDYATGASWWRSTGGWRKLNRLTVPGPPCLLFPVRSEFQLDPRIIIFGGQYFSAQRPEGLGTRCRFCEVRESNKLTFT